MLRNLILMPLRVVFEMWLFYRNARECDWSIEQYQREVSDIDSEMGRANGGKRGRHYQGLRR